MVCKNNELKYRQWCRCRNNYVQCLYFADSQRQWQNEYLTASAAGDGENYVPNTVRTKRWPEGPCGGS